MRTHVDAFIVNAFTDAAAGGNPAGVVPEADGLTRAQKQQVAREIGLSETAFVSRSEVATAKLEFFTPTRQIAHCGHATVATFSLLRTQGRLGDGAFTKETIDGLRDIVIEDGRVYMEQRAPRYQDFAGGSDVAARVAQSLGLASLPHAPVIVDTGTGFMVVELSDIEAVRRLQPDHAAIAAVSETHDLIGYYVFARGARKAGRAASTRMFAPRYGIDEEAATGMAAGALACLLHERHALPTVMRIEQGALMDPASPSVIEVRLKVEAGRINGLLAGGTATQMRRVEVPVSE